MDLTANYFYCNFLRFVRSIGWMTFEDPTFVTCAGWITEEYFEPQSAKERNICRQKIN